MKFPTETNEITPSLEDKILASDTSDKKQARNFSLQALFDLFSEGFGGIYRKISESYSKNEIDTKFSDNVINENTKLNQKADKSSTLDGYGITDGEKSINKTGDIEGNKTDTTKYATVKAIYDFVISKVGASTSGPSNVLGDKKLFLRTDGDNNHYIAFDPASGDGVNGMRYHEIGGFTFSTNYGDVIKIKSVGGIEIKTRTDTTSDKKIIIGNRNQISNIPHSQGGHISQVLWGDLINNPENGSNDGGWGLIFGTNANPFVKMIGNDTWIGKTGGWIRTNSAQGTDGNCLTRKDYVDSIAGGKKVVWQSGNNLNVYSGTRCTITHNLGISEDDFMNGRYGVECYYYDGGRRFKYTGEGQFSGSPTSYPLYWDNNTGYYNQGSIWDNGFSIVPPYTLKKILIYKNY